MRREDGDMQLLLVRKLHIKAMTLCGLMLAVS